MGFVVEFPRLVGAELAVTSDTGEGETPQ